jgi:hypothetical protein
MFRAILISGLTTLVVGSAFGAISGSEGSRAQLRSAEMRMAQQCAYEGTYATQRRAYERAAELRYQGYDARVVPAGNDEWNVLVC